MHMKLLLALFCLTLSTLSFSQEELYSYSFSGDIDSAFVKELEKESMKIEGVTSVKAKYKVEKKMGELLIYTKKDESKKDPFIFSPAEIKAIILRNGLKPERFIQLKSSK